MVERCFNMFGFIREIRGGIYRAGYDFPVGEILIKCPEPGTSDLCCGAGLSPRDIRADKYFRDSMWLDLKRGEYVKIDTSNEDDDFVMHVYGENTRREE